MSNKQTRTPASQTAPQGIATQGAAVDTKFREETAEATAGDLMMESALMAPASVPQVAATEVAPAEEKAAQIGGKSSASVNVNEAALPLPLPYIGGVEGKATAKEIALALAEVMGPVLAAITPDPSKQMEATGRLVEEIVKRLREPTEEEKAILARKKVDRQKLIHEQFEMIARQKQIHDMCPHERGTVDGKSHTTVTALHNYIDGQLRGTCSLCQKIIEADDPAFRMVIMSHNLAMDGAR